MLTSHFSRADWWIAAVVAGTAAAVAFQSLILERKNKWKVVVLPLGAALAIGLDSAARQYEGNTPLMLYTLGMLGLALTRVVFARYIGRQIGRARAGEPVEVPTPGQITIFVVTLMAIMLAIAVTV
ncbi:hypothetical protein PV396_43805 [Streptomyces sp. ME02-8801-2C]|uniref:hypothetical protein n=1 Tax=Streptomyces sp. ME02-8801-2C TaxID=3028680 RepID=UPI00299FD512|nr:hypothetical protein [Streptomyces sp. ME02-8801-2C]MDX3458771.1 hypothetical protein [Streptomyces sp. ME02-8801-2C]